MITTPKHYWSLAALATLTITTACGGSGSSENLFTKKFEPKEGQAALAITGSEVTGYWESSSGNIVTRMKVEEDKVTIAVNCEEIDAIAQDSASIKLDRDNESVSLTGEIKDQAKGKFENGTDAVCKVFFAKGLNFSYSLNAGSLDIYSTNAASQFSETFQKLSDLEK